jgi:hypothetical protein
MHDVPNLHTPFPVLKYLHVIVVNLDYLFVRGEERGEGRGEERNLVLFNYVILSGRIKNHAL